MLEKLLGRISSLGEVSDFTTQTGNFTGNTTLYRRQASERRIPRGILHMDDSMHF